MRLARKRQLLAAGLLCTLMLATAGLYPQPAKAPARTEAPRTKVPSQAVSGTATMQTPMSLTPDVPVRLRIPKLGVNAPVEPQGRTSTGEMQAPAGRLTTGWYKSGFLPGSIGNAAIAGHSSHIEGRGVFYDLNKLTAGDEVQIETATHALTFRVASIKTYPADAAQLQDVFGPGDKARLNLITCTGIWTEAAKNYSDRLVVFTEFKSERHL